MTRYDFRGRVALVTGGSSGIGAAAAAALRDGGAEVAVFDLSVDGVEGMAIAGDISRSDDVDQAVARVEDELGPIDIVVNSAGVGGPWRSALELSDEDWRRVMEINLSGTFYVCRAAVPRMGSRGYGRVVLISSIAGKNGNRLLPAYSASKAGVIAFAKSLAVDVAQSGVLINVVAPAVIETPLATVESSHMLEHMISKVPMGRIGRPDEAAALISWLASEDCSFSTGSVYDLSGGSSVY